MFDICANRSHWDLFAGMLTEYWNLSKVRNEVIKIDSCAPVCFDLIWVCSICFWRWHGRSGERQTLRKKWILFRRSQKPNACLTGFFSFGRSIGFCSFCYGYNIPSAMYSIIIFFIDLILSNINMDVKYGKDVCTPLTNRELECNKDGVDATAS